MQVVTRYLPDRSATGKESPGLWVGPTARPGQWTGETENLTPNHDPVSILTEQRKGRDRWKNKRLSSGRLLHFVAQVGILFPAGSSNSKGALKCDVKRGLYNVTRFSGGTETAIDRVC